MVGYLTNGMNNNIELINNIHRIIQNMFKLYLNISFIVHFSFIYYALKK